VTDHGNFEHGTSILSEALSVEQVAHENGASAEWARGSNMRAALCWPRARSAFGPTATTRCSWRGTDS
jgi:hypothetical protein